MDIKRNEQEPLQWYAMRALFGKEPEMARRLEQAGMSCFIPMRYVIRLKHGRKIRELVPVIRNLIFVQAFQSRLKTFKAGQPYLQYLVDSRSRRKIIVPDEEMCRFIAVAGTYNDQLLYFSPEEVNLARGTRVRIIGGEFEGHEGIFLKVRGARDRRVVIAIQGVIAVAMATIHPNLIQVIDG